MPNHGKISNVLPTKGKNMYQIKSHKLFNNEKQVEWYPSRNKSGVMKPLYIVCHDTASPLGAQSDVRWLAGEAGNHNSSAHFVVARDGKITQLVPTNVMAWHAGASKWNGRTNCNAFTIGIEIDNPGKVEKVREGVYHSYYGNIVDSQEVHFAYAKTPQHGEGYWAFYTPEQINAVVGICQACIKAYGCSEIITHWLIAPGRKVDTNPLFPLAQVRERAFGNKDVLAEKPAEVAGWGSSPQPQIVFVADATVTVDDLKLRANPMMGDNIIASLDAGTRVDVQAKHGEWYKVITSDKKGGYLYQDFVKLD